MTVSDYPCCFNATILYSLPSPSTMAGIFLYVIFYRFNGKESQEFAGLLYLDYGARFYHPLSSRWTTLDPIEEKYYSVSPYMFCTGNLETWRKA